MKETIMFSLFYVDITDSVYFCHHNFQLVQNVHEIWQVKVFDKAFSKNNADQKEQFLKYSLLFFCV